MLRNITAVSTMGTIECAEELNLFLRALRTFHPELPVAVGCTSELIQATRNAPTTGTHSTFSEMKKHLNDGKTEWIPCLDRYGAINRKTMEKQKGIWYPAMHTDMMMEKSNLMEFLLANLKGSVNRQPLVAFLDCDITLLNPLPSVPSDCQVILSPHYIREEDERLFGRYNGGYLATDDPLFLFEWRKATRHSRFYDQASLEDVAALYGEKVHHLPPQDNFGFWRLTQAQSGNLEKEASQFSIEQRGNEKVKTLCYEGEPLRSLHTHFYMVPKEANDVQLFNTLLLGWIHECAQSTPGSFDANHAYDKILGDIKEPL